MEELKVVCCLKSGGDYDWDYVLRLREGVAKNISHFHEFICYTDSVEKELVEIEEADKGITIKPLTTGMESYWAKLEVFKEHGDVIYFDLDTMILNNIDDLVFKVISSKTRSDRVNHFYMMRPFMTRRREHTSGIMAWSGNYQYILDNYFLMTEGLRARYGKWEQDYISDEVSLNQEIEFVDDYINIKSYKWHCREGIPEGTDVVVFHGHPRPHEVNWLEGKVCV